MNETFTFPRAWTAEILKTAPLIAPARAYTYPHDVAGEEDAMARGALQLMIRPAPGGAFLATCALGFQSPTVPTGVWGAPRPETMCAVAGGYAYLIETMQPEVSAMVPLRPVVEVREAVEDGLLLLVGFHTIVGWGPSGQAWETERLSWEGLRLGPIEDRHLTGWGWEMISDREVAFTVDLRTGAHQGGAYRR